MVKLFLRNNDMSYIPLDNGLRIQVLPDFSYLPECQKHHFAAFIQNPSILVVWDDDPNHLLPHAQSIEDQLMNMVWNHDGEDNEKASTAVSSKAASRAPSIYGKEVGRSQDSNSEESLAEPPRKIVLVQPLLTAVTLALIFAAIGSGWRQIAVELMVDSGWIRLAFVVVVPLQIWLALVRPFPNVLDVTSLIFVVLYAVCCRLRSSDHRSYQPDDRKHQILFWDRSNTAGPGNPSSCHDSVSSV